MVGTQIISQYAIHKPKGINWSPKPLALARRHPLRPIAERTLPTKSPVTANQLVLKVQDEHHEEHALVEPKMQEGVKDPAPEGATDSSGPTSPARSSDECAALDTGISPEDFLRNALPATHTFASAPTADHQRLGISPTHRLRPSSSMSNISSNSNKSRPPSSMSINGRARRSSSRTSRFSDPRNATPSPSATSS